MQLCVRKLLKFSAWPGRRKGGAVLRCDCWKVGVSILYVCVLGCVGVWV